jgi:hypothetical protein
MLNVMTYETAREIAAHFIEEHLQPNIEEEVTLQTEFEETKSYWVFFYNTRDYIETGNISYALLGNGPLLVEKSTGRARLGRSDSRWREEISD